jgi:hypothetical protein
MKLHKLICVTAIAISLSLTGCGPAPLVKANEPVKVKSLSFSSPIDWNQFGDARQRSLTLDGFYLNQVMIFADLKPGEHIFLERKGWSERRGEGALLQKGMNAIEFQEMLVDLLKSRASEITASNMRPVKFGGKQGFRFDLSYLTGANGSTIRGKSGLRYRGTVFGELQDDNLSYFLYAAPEEFYFERDVAVVEKIFASVQTK